MLVVLGSLGLPKHIRFFCFVFRDMNLLFLYDVSAKFYLLTMFLALLYGGAGGLVRLI